MKLMDYLQQHAGNYTDFGGLVQQRLAQSKFPDLQDNIAEQDERFRLQEAVMEAHGDWYDIRNEIFQLVTMFYIQSIESWAKEQGLRRDNNEQTHTS